MWKRIWKAKNTICSLLKNMSFMIKAFVDSKIKQGLSREIGLFHQFSWMKINRRITNTAREHKLPGGFVFSLYCLSFETYHLRNGAHCFHLLFLKNVSVNVQRGACLGVTKAGGDRVRIDTARNQQRWNNCPCLWHSSQMLWSLPQMSLPYAGCTSSGQSRKSRLSIWSLSLCLPL